MRTVLFTKLFGQRSAAEIGRTAAELGFDGIDLLIRDGFTIEPADAASIGRAAETCAALGVPILTATTDLTDPGAFPTERVVAGCVEAGVRTLRLGYWPYDGATPYPVVFDRAVRDLDRLEPIAATYGVTFLLQLHGGTIHSSGALAARLLDGRDPGHFGSYIDPGNQAVQDGREDWRLTLDLLGDRLRCVGLKNGLWAAGPFAGTGQRRWTSDWCGVPDGMVPWDDILRHLAGTGFSGELSFHGHYDLPYEQVLDQTRTDLRYVRRILAGVA